MEIQLTAITDMGKARGNNEDAVAVCSNLETRQWVGEGPCRSDCSRHAIALVADGLGGENAGEVASAIVIDTFADLQPPSLSTDSAYHEQLSQVIAASDDNIFAHAQQHPETRGMGTTVTACWLHNGRAHVAWCGDSRCYLFSPQHGLRQMTHDHSYVQELIDQGKITRRKAFHHPDNHIITRGCGDLDCSADPEFVDFDISAGEMIMLCSDGLFGCCYDSEIELTLYRHYGDITACRDALLHAALDAGAPDNVSVVVVSVTDDNTTSQHLGLRGLFSYWRKLAIHRLCQLLHVE